eukprot:336042-Pleurochrysis_carterae.AAC.1
MLCARPPPSMAQLSMQSAVRPFWVRNEDMPSGREKGPEKSMRTRREALGAPCFGIWRRWGEANAASAETEEGAATPGGCEPSSSARCANSACDGFEGNQGNDRSSKYTSDVTTIRLIVGIQTFVGAAPERQDAHDTRLLLGEQLVGGGIRVRRAARA